MRHVVLVAALLVLATTVVLVWGRPVPDAPTDRVVTPATAAPPVETEVP